MSSSSAHLFSVPVRVYYEDTDAAGFVFYANYLKFMERARTELLRSLALESSILMGQQRVFVVVDVQVKYHAPARLDDVLDVTAVFESVGRSRVVFQQQVTRKGGTEVLCSGRITAACLDTVTMKPVALSPEILATFRSMVP